MRNAPAHRALTDALQSQVPGIRWPAVTGARESAVLSLLFQMEHSQWLPGEALRARQAGQLDALLAHARHHCRFYRNRLPIDTACWHEIPLLTRQDLQTQAQDLYAFTYPRAHGKTFDISTAGSTAEPVTVRRTALTQLFWQAATLRDHLWHRRDLPRPRPSSANSRNPSIRVAPAAGVASWPAARRGICRLQPTWRPSCAGCKALFRTSCSPIRRTSMPC